MADYYAILCVDKKATSAEIKNAFRKLAKIYHPDKNPNNPNAKVLFEQILSAYHVLNNQYSRKRYDDLHFNVQTHVHQKQTTKTQKEWTFTDEDLKRREYYKNHYKAKEHIIKDKPQQPKYNDFKYILFATPLAVGLLMLIVSFFSQEPNTVDSVPIKQPIVSEKTIKSSIKNGDTPYRGIFGSIKTFETPFTLQINNSSQYDAIICLYENKTNLYLQHTFLQSQFGVEFKNLPKNGVYWRCFFGKNWNADIVLKDTVLGGFDSIVQFQNWKNNPQLFTKNNVETINVIDIISPKTENKIFISTEKEFFEYKYTSQNDKKSSL